MENMRTKLAGLTLATTVALGAGVAAIPEADAQTDRSEQHELRMQQREERLQQLQDDGVITTERAEEIRARHAERQAAREERRAKALERREALAATLGTTAEELTADLRAGASLAEIAQAAGIDIDGIIDQFELQATERLAEAVTNERITQDQADEKLETIRERITDRVNGERPERGPRGRFGRFGRPGRG